MSRPSDILSDLTVELLQNEYDWEREKKGELNRGRLDKQLADATDKALDNIAALSSEPGPKREEITRKELEQLLETARDIYTKVGVEFGTKLAQQKLQQKMEQNAESPTLPQPQPETEIPTEGKPVPPTSGEPRRDSTIYGLDEKMIRDSNLQIIGTQIFHGGERAKLIRKPYRQRKDDAQAALQKSLVELVDKKTAFELDSIINDYATTLGEVFFGQGMQIGARITAQLLGCIDKDYC